MYSSRYEPDAHGTPLDDVVVREATDADVPAAAALLALREGDADPDWETRLRFWLASDHRVFVAQRAGEIVGYARLAWQTPGANGGRNAPDGFYFSGIFVHPAHRRRGIGRALTLARAQWTAQRRERAFFVVNAANHASMDLHRELGFREVSRDFDFPGITFTGGEGVLFEADPSRQWQQVTQLRVRAAG